MTNRNTNKRPTTSAPPILKEASCVQKSSNWLSCCLTFSPLVVRFANLGALSTDFLSTLGMPVEKKVFMLVA